MNVLSLFAKIKHFVLDVDGVLTSGELLLLESGEMVRTMHVKDGYAMQLAVKKGYTFYIISGANSGPALQRLQKLGIVNIHMGIADKQNFLQSMIVNNRLSADEILYMGDDIPDLEAMNLTGLPCCPADAVNDIKRVSKYISPVKGGMGCVRDVIEKTLRVQSKWTHDATAKSL